MRVSCASVCACVVRVLCVCCVCDVRVFVRVLCARGGACRCHRPKKSLALGFFAEMIIMSGRPRGIFDSWH